MKHYFSKREWVLWLGSMATILVSYFLFRQESFMVLIASLLGVTSLIFCAKGNPIGQVMMITFGTIYGYISYTTRYYSEMVTYLGMTVPMAVYALICWLKNPFQGKKSEVTVNRIRKKEWWFLLFLTALVTAIFYFVLNWLDTPNLWWSTLSVSTSFAACYLTARRSPYFALVYSLNDIVLIVLWVLASFWDFNNCCESIF
ncbi:MAG: nicotinamide mononucleotide transporter [Paludibacteraceae bacterium]|nr:nicotinamide mononucleotide transporter [Paludibacteraceae bacterium]